MTAPDPRPEMAIFRALGTARGWKPVPPNDDEQTDFRFDTSPADEVTLTFQDQGEDWGGLDLYLNMYPGDELRAATPEEMAATIARWLRDTADAVEGRAVRPAPLAVEAAHV